MARVACRAEGSPRAGVASRSEGLTMVGRPSAARTLTVQRSYEFARLQQQLLSLAYEQLLPIVRPPTKTGPCRFPPAPPRGDSGCPRNKEVPDHASV
jgi:hypothetical protein